MVLAAAREVRLNIVPTSGGGGCYGDSESGRKTRQNVTSALRRTTRQMWIMNINTGGQK